MMMRNCLGHNTIANTLFSSNGTKETDSAMSGGGAVIEYSYCNSDTPTNSCFPETLYENVTYTIQSCIFQHNTVSVTYPTDAHGNEYLYQSEFGRGGGLLISLKARVANINITINSSSFHNNSAWLGGGLFYEADSITNNVKLDVIDTHFTNNTQRTNGNHTALTLGGAVGLYFLGEDGNYSVQHSDSRVSFTNCSFVGNYATTGGAISLIVFGRLQRNLISKVIFSQCNFFRNMARVGSAFLATTWNDQSYGYMAAPSFYSCSFTNNMIHSENNAAIGMGIIYSESVTLRFFGNTTFAQNSGTALVLSSTNVQFKPNSSTVFHHNQGYNGGAIALLNRAWLEVNDHTELKFFSNCAKHKGGAIYVASFGGQNVVAAFYWTCFVRQECHSALPSEWNAKLHFGNNMANGETNSIYVTSILPCTVPVSKCTTSNITNVFCCWKGWNFINSSCHREVATSSAGFKYNTSLSSPIKVSPGLQQPLPFSVYDDWGNNVTSDTTLKAYVSGDTTAHLDTSGFKINGNASNVTIKVDVRTIEPRVLNGSFEVELIPCPPGMEMNNTSEECICIYRLPGIVNCSYAEGKSSISPYWCMSNVEGAVLVGKWTLVSELSEFDYYDLPPNISALSNVCSRMNRTGRMCSKCIEGYGFAAFTLDYPCVKCKNESITPWLLYTMVEFVPITVFFLAIVLFNVNINNGKTNTLVLLCQIVSLPLNVVTLQATIRVIIHSPILSKIIQLIILAPYSIWNLDSFKLLIPPFCLVQKAKMIHVLTLNYVTAIYPLLLVVLCYLLIELHGRNFRPVVLLWVPFRKCFGRFHRSFEIKTSVIEAFASFLILSYMKFAQVTAMLLIPNRLYHSNGTVDDLMVLLMDASIDYGSSEHLPYLVTAVLVLVFILIVPPLFLLLYPFHWFQQCLKRCRMWGPAVTTFADAFQWCYRDSSDGGIDCRFFASLYLFARLLYVMMLVLFPDINSLAIAELLSILIFILMISSFQPYKRKLYNILDSFVFSLMALLPTTTLYFLNRDFYFTRNKLHPVLAFGFLLLLLLPVGYMVAIFSFAILKRIKKKVILKQRARLGYQPLSQVGLESSSSERVYDGGSQVMSRSLYEEPMSDSVPYRLLHPNTSPGSF